MANVTGQRIEPAVAAVSALIEMRGVEKVTAPATWSTGAAAVDLAIWPGGSLGRVRCAYVTNRIGGPGSDTDWPVMQDHGS
jgi:hypothetical protein